MHKYRILTASVVLLVLSAWIIAPKWANDFEPYEQTIPHTSLSFGMVPIPGGTFKMGSTKGKSDEAPVHEVELDPFWMGTHEVTWDLYEMFLDKNFESSVSDQPLTSEVDGLTRPSIPYLDMTFGMGKHGKPAIGMTQYGAIQFCRWLYLKTGIFYRLPTEAEWEYASRAGATTEYFFGDDPKELDKYAWFGINAGESTQEIGKKMPNPWGLYDIYGNVNEWTIDHYVSDMYQKRTGSVAKNPLWMSEDLYPKVLRGGSYKSTAAELRSAHRVASTAQWKRIDPQIPKSQWWFPEAPFVGMRVVRPVNPPSLEEIEKYYGTLPEEDY
ncbi:formylglycine-generating enzyme family protein [Lunatimonas salinarum]|uniref:formylglycine-generating enzyme family protein n=1 Tax=Lunatimonas salinarum TaxID=1774590 RepID=UPI001AE06C89|nr:SUMF1/EgtB/PvdO family nonheme iron enzyme [Lunatimonas salinarum]